LKRETGQTDGGPTKTLVLLAEDSQVTAELIQKMLEFFGYQVIVARNGVEAVAKAAAEIPDLIVMDIHMPVMDGLQAAVEIRKDPKTKSIPILAATAKAMAGDEERCLASGCDSYISKPFTHTQLAAAVKKLLSEPLADRK
jgi:CheY-like chemotaxis protein